jgi:hypothetical protein
MAPNPEEMKKPRQTLAAAATLALRCKPRTGVAAGEEKREQVPQLIHCSQLSRLLRRGRQNNGHMNLRPLLLLCLACASASLWATSPPRPPSCVNTGPTRECIAPPRPVPGPSDPTRPVRPTAPPDNLLVNGSFEEPALAHGSWDVFQAVPGWVAVDGPGIEIQRGAAGPAHHGEQLVELDSHANSAMVQAVAVEPGQTYELRFWTMTRPGTRAETNGLDVFVNDSRVHRVRHAAPVPAQFTEVQLRWTAGPGVRQALLRFEASGCSDGLGSYLDAVSWRRVGRD